jgi:tryprostatin B 6-hydroxylase
VALLIAFNHAYWIIFGYLTALFSSITIYRVYFHRLSRFPGPKWARITKIWHAWQSRHCQNFLVLSELHRKYGDFVRTGKAKLHCSWRIGSNYSSTQAPARSQSTTRMFSWP